MNLICFLNIFFLRAKLVNVTLALNFTRFLRKETAFLPWELAIKNLKYYVHMFDRSEVYGPLQVISSALSQHYQDTPTPPNPPPALVSSGSSCDW